MNRSVINKKHLVSMAPQWRSGSAQNWQTRGTMFKILSRMSTQPLGLFNGFLRNLRKYGLGSLKKTPTEGTPPYRPRSHDRTIGLTPSTNQLTSGQLALNLQSNLISMLAPFSPEFFKLEIHLAPESARCIFPASIFPNAGSIF